MTLFLRINVVNIVLRFSHLLFEVFTKIKNPLAAMVPEWAPISLFFGLKEVWVSKFDLKNAKNFFLKLAGKGSNGSEWL